MAHLEFYQAMIDSYAIKNLRHYIYIDSDNVHEDLGESETLERIKQLHRKHLVNGEDVVYWSYDAIAGLLKTYDEELYDLYIEINTNYPALLADIGRMIILYTYGGIYSDLKYVSTHIMHNEIPGLIDAGIEVVGETPPKSRFLHRVRNTNILATTKQHIVFADTLSELKKRLHKAKKDKAFGAEVMYKIGTGSYTYAFFRHLENDTTMVTNKMQWNRLVRQIKGIHNMRSRIWQSTSEYIFKL